MKTKRLFPAILLGIMTLISTTASAQSVFQKGTVTFSAGVGVGAEYNSNYYNSGIGTKAVVEVGMWPAGPGTVSIGGQAGASFSNGGYYDDYRTSTFVVAARAAWHHGWNINGLDTYAGLSAGAGFNNYRYYRNETVRSSEVIPAFGGFIGASYFVTPQFGFNVEAGRDITSIQAGIIFKIK
jgi:hypothetical protein